MTDAINVAVIGYGYWGPNLARNFHQLPDTRLALVADLDAARLAEVARLYPTTTVTTDYRQALANPEIAAVAVATPVRTHFAIAREALLAGKHVLVEKPLALTATEAEALIALAEQQQRTLMVGHTFEYNPAVWKIKELIAAGEIGQVYYAYANRVNLGRVQYDVNALWSIAPHDISILLYLLEAMPLAVSAHGATYLSQGVEDVIFLTLTFPGNVLAHVQASWLDPSKVRRLTIVGSEKMIVYDDVDNEAKVKIYDKGVYRKGSAYGEFQVRVHSGDIHIPRIDMTEPLRNECAHFVECVRTGQRPRTDGACGLRVVRVLEAAQRSLEQGGASVQV